MLRRRPRQSRAIELCNRTEVKRKANTFCRCKTTIERKGIHTWLVDGKIRAVCCVANRCAIRQRIPIKQQRRLTGARLRRCGVCRQQLHIRTATGRTCRTRCTSRACGACYTSRACRTCCACYTGRTSWACWACWARYARRTCRSCWARYTGRAGWTGRYMFLYTTLLLRKLESILAFYIAFLLSKASNSRRLFSIYSSIRRCWSAKVNSIVISPFL